jgi:hypothetical protein
MKVFFSLLLTILLSANKYSYSQSSDVFPDSIKHIRFYSAIATGASFYAGGLSYLSFVWYKDKERVPFHLYDDSKGYLQMDKFGHAFGAYWESYHAYNALRWAGVDKKRALLFAGPVGLIFQTPIEVFDGLYKGWGFSWPDMGANAFGSALFSAQQALFGEQIVLMKFSYSPSGYPKYHHILGETPVQSFFLDYNGHTHWLSANMRQITGINAIPQWLNLAVGYSGNGMIYEFENPTWYMGKPFPHLERYRQYFLSFDVDLTRIPAKRKWVRAVFKTVNIIKIPFPALEFNRIDGAKFWLLYF